MPIIWLSKGQQLFYCLLHSYLNIDLGFIFILLIETVEMLKNTNDMSSLFPNYEVLLWTRINIWNYFALANDQSEACISESL